MKEKIRAYCSHFEGEWEAVFDGKRRWENIAYMRCRLTGLLLFLPPLLWIE